MRRNLRRVLAQTASAFLLAALAVHGNPASAGQIASADLVVTKAATPDPVTAGADLTYTITVTNAGPGDALNVTLLDPLPAGTTFVSLSAPGGWSCTTPAVGAGGDVTCTLATLPVGSAVFTLVVNVGPAASAELSNTAVAVSDTPDPNPKDQTGTALTTVETAADLAVAKVDTPDPVPAGANLTYTITVTNAGPSNAAVATLSDTLPAGTTFVSLAVPAGWGCTTPAVGAGGTVSCAHPSAPVGSAVFTLVVAVGAGVTDGTVLSNTATVTSDTPDPEPGDESATATTTVDTVTVLTATKTVAGTFEPGSTVTYTVVVSNPSSQAQADNPGAELTDVLPAELTLVSATATSGTAVATIATNTVTWNGPVPANGSVTITIQATVNTGVPAGTLVANQAAIFYDADGDGTNESAAISDDPSVGGADDPTTFRVGAQLAIEVPTLGGAGLALLALCLALGGAVLLRRRLESRTSVVLQKGRSRD